MVNTLENLRMANNKSNMQILSKLIEKHNNDDYTDEEREKMTKLEKVYNKFIAELKAEINEK